MMKRRQFLAVAASAGLMAPAIAQTTPDIRWRLGSSFPASLSTIFAGAQTFADIVREATDGRFIIDVHAAGEIGGALDIFDAVKTGSVECAQTALHYQWGREPALIFATGIPFGLNAREQNAFFYRGGGNDLVNELLVDFGIVGLPAGNTGCQMGGWFRNEIGSANDMRGLKFRISGIAAKIMQQLGAEPVSVGRSDMAPAFEQNRLDAAAWVSPVDDEKLGLTGVAPFYYYPGWFQTNMAVHLVFNLAKWNALPKAYQAILRAAAAATNADVMANYDAANPAAVRRLVEGGAKLRAFPADLMEAGWQAANAVYRDTAASNPRFQRLLDIYMGFRNDQYLWWQVAEYPNDNFLIRQRAKG